VIHSCMNIERFSMIAWTTYIQMIGFGFLCIFAFFSDVSLSMANFGIDAAFIISLIILVMQRQRINQLKLPFLLSSIYIIVLIVSAIHAIDPQLSLQPIWRSTYYMWAPFFVAWQIVDTEKKGRLLVLLLMLSAASSGIYTIWQSGQGVYRAVGFIDMLETATHTAQLSLVLLVFVVHEYRSGRSLSTGQAVVSMALFLILFISMLATNNRQTWLAYSGTFLFFLIICKTSWKKMISAVVAIMLIVAAVTTIIPAAGWRMRMLLDIHDRSANERLLMWSEAGQRFLDRPILGIGPGNTAVFQTYESAQPGKRYTHPHSTLFQLLSETGILGFLCYYLLYGYIFVSLYKVFTSTHDPWILSAMLIIVVTQLCGLTENYLFGVVSARQVEWFFLGMAWRQKNRNSQLS